jgi:hypothetical protein
LVVAVDVVEPLRQRVERGAIAPASLVDARLGPRDELIAAPARAPDADDWEVELAALRHGV